MPYFHVTLANDENILTQICVSSDSEEDAQIKAEQEINSHPAMVELGHWKIKHITAHPPALS